MSLVLCPSRGNVSHPFCDLHGEIECLDWPLDCLLIQAVGVKLERIVLTRLVGSTYYSRLVLRQAEQVTSIDSRPSDSLALALQGKTPIFASKELMRQVLVPERLQGSVVRSLYWHRKPLQMEARRDNVAITNQGRTCLLCLASPLALGKPFC